MPKTLYKQTHINSRSASQSADETTDSYNLKLDSLQVSNPDDYTLPGFEEAEDATFMGTSGAKVRARKRRKYNGSKLLTTKNIFSCIIITFLMAVAGLMLYAVISLIFANHAQHATITTETRQTVNQSNADSNALVNNNGIPTPAKQSINNHITPSPPSPPSSNVDKNPQEPNSGNFKGPTEYSDDNNDKSPSSSSSQSPRAEFGNNDNSKLENKPKWSYKSLGILDSENDDDDTSSLQTIINFDNGKFLSVIKHPAIFNLQYPNGDIKESRYENNIFHRWCHVFSLPKKENKNKNKIDSRRVQIDIQFNVFSLERGFDRLLVRLFNSTIMKPPIVVAGRGFYDVNNQKEIIINKQWRVPDNLTFYLHSGETLGVCLELETDEDNGACDDSLKQTQIQQSQNANKLDSTNACDIFGALDINILARYDDICSWQDWTPCHAVKGRQWDGECGVGVTQRIRDKKSVKNQEKSIENKSGYIQDCNGTEREYSWENYKRYSYDEGIEGPFYCDRGPCGPVNQTLNPLMPKGAQRFWNGHNRVDPDNPEIFSLFYATEEDLENSKQAEQKCLYLISQPTNTIQDKIDILKSIENSKDKNCKMENVNIIQLKNLISNLKKELQTIINNRESEHLLDLAILRHKYFNQSQKYLGARLAHSLLIGRPFITAFTGSSNTAGHDNMFASTYPIQINSIMRPIWQKYGNVGASFNSRNVAIGGSLSTGQHGLMSHLQTSETPASSYFNYEATFGKYNQFSMNNTIDIIFWESFMNDGGRPPKPNVETFFRNVAATNALFGAINMVSGCGKQTKNVPWDTLWKGAPHMMPSRSKVFEYC